MSVWRGPKTLQIVDDDWDLSAEKTTVILTYEGPRADCRSRAPALFSTIAGWPGYITNVKIPPGQTPDGRLIITLDAIFNTIYELDWATCFKKLLTMPIFQPGGDQALDDGDLDIINEWTNAATATLRSSVYARVTSAFPEAKYYIDKIKLGEEEYPVAYPIARMTTKTPQPPAGVGEGMYVAEAPPVPCNAPAGNWHYYKSADSCLYEGRIYTRRQEWTGAQKLDADIFGGGMGAKRKSKK